MWTQTTHFDVMSPIFGNLVRISTLRSRLFHAILTSIYSDRTYTTHSGIKVGKIILQGICIKKYIKIEQSHMLPCKNVPCMTYTNWTMGLNLCCGLGLTNEAPKWPWQFTWYLKKLLYLSKLKITLLASGRYCVKLMPQFHWWTI